VGTEHIDDIIADFEQSFAKASAATTEGGEKEHAILTGKPGGAGKLGGAT
jgi:O-acetylhomoserine/O-acetylserine sulfhydrylase